MNGHRLLRFAPWACIAWTVFLWISRLRNVVRDDDLSTIGRGVRVLIVVVFVALAVWAGLDWWRKRARGLVVLCLWTLGYWLVRGTGILIGDWSVGFKVVHTLLWIVSTVAAVGALLAIRTARAARSNG